ncbi:signal peptidase I [Arthrobacter sp. E918]|uniref:Signal peptidase I n=2 Tax=Arthrobacter mobilis TaxID=2724944 RepID=A0A7X6K5J2_9MICC|nr:signal peptidase I [Arthrobacter mobilis]
MTVAVVAPLLGIGFSSVLTGSMRPAHAPGDLLITYPVTVNDLKEGQVIVFTPPDENALFAHRIASIQTTAAGPVLVTKGDANPAPDAWRLAASGPRIPVVVASLPQLGSALSWLQSPPVRSINVALLGLLLTAASVIGILRQPVRTA